MYSTLHKIKLIHVLSRNLITERFLPFKLFYKMFRKLSFSRTKTINGSSIKILVKDGMGVMNFISDYEPWLDELLPKLLDKDATFLDVGANVGQTMIKVLSRFPHIPYLAVEPNENCVNYLRVFVEANNFTSVSLFECALSDADGDAELLTRYDDDILATTTHSFRKFTKYATKKQVRMTTGDALIEGEDVTKISVIKIDIEGGEARALDGLVNTIKKFQPYIICEINPLPTEDEGVTEFRTMSANKILSMLDDLDYVVINAITGSTVSHIEDLSKSLESCNYLFIPKVKGPYIVTKVNP